MIEEQELTRKRTPSGARLPQVPLEEAIGIARALADLAGPSTPQRIAQRMGVSPSSSGFKSRLAAAGYFGLLRQEGDRRQLTDRGTQAIGEGAESLTARRQAVVSSSYRAILVLLRGREVDEEVIRARLQDDLGVPEGSSGQIARALIDSSEQAQLIASGRFDTTAIEESRDSLPASDDHGRTPPESARTTSVTSHTAAKGKQVSTRKGHPPAPEHAGRRPNGGGAKHAVVPPFPPTYLPSSSNLIIQLRLDLSNLSVDQVVDLIQKLSRPDSSGTSAS